MSGLEDRLKSMEAKLAHDSELRFKVAAHGNKILGLLVAEKLGKTGDEAEAYAKEVILSDFEEVGDDDVVRKVHADLTAAGIEMSADDVHEALVSSREKAADELMHG